MKFLLLYNFSNTLELDIWDYLIINPDLGIETILGLLAERRVLTTHEDLRYQQFIKKIESCQDWQLHDHSLAVLGRAWYQAVYDAGDHKFKVLQILNKLLKNWLSAKKMFAKPKLTAARSKRPKLLVILEQFCSNHAMYRCYSNGIEALKQDFKLIAVATPNGIDEISRKLFDEIITVDIQVPTDLARLLAKINKVKADACYFTSVGMQFWSIALANLRLAPMQFVTAGHPISTCSSEIDFMLLEDHKFDKKIFFSEQVLGLPSGNFGFVLPEMKLPQRQQQQQGELRIALTASAYKLNADFLATCQAICQQTNKKVVICSMSNCRGINFHQLNRKLRQCLDNVYVYPTLNFDDYLQYLSECHLYLAPFPFGGTNSTIDCVLLGVPLLSLDVADLACADPFILRKIGLAECIANSPAEFITTAVSWLNDEEKLLSIREKLLSLGTNLGGLLGGVESGQAYLDVVKKAYQHHQAIKQAAKPLVAYEEMMAL